MTPFTAALIRQRLYPPTVDRLFATGWLLDWLVGGYRLRFHGAECLNFATDSDKAVCRQRPHSSAPCLELQLRATRSRQKLQDACLLILRYSL
jgi:hypothetical protein